MNSKDKILHYLDDFHSKGFYFLFPDLDVENSRLSLAGTRLSVYGDTNNWAIAIELIGLSKNDFEIQNNLYLFGNCLKNLQDSAMNGYPTNLKIFPIIKYHELSKVLDNDLFLLDSAKNITINNSKVEISNNLKDYQELHIKLEEYENPDKKIDIKSLTRFLVEKNYTLFTLSDNEITNYIPSNLKRILLLRNWHHKNYNFVYFSGEYIGEKPSSYETFRMIADVIVTQDSSKYTPALPPNTHWINWAENW